MTYFFYTILLLSGFDRGYLSGDGPDPELPLRQTGQEGQVQGPHIGQARQADHSKD